MTIANILDNARQQLLDIGTRNRLVSTPRRNQRQKQVEVIHERSEHLFEILSVKGKTMTFLPLGSDDDNDGDSRQQTLLSLMVAESDEATPDHHTDTNLQTDLSPKKLQKKLRDIFNDSRTFVEEQGVNPLYLAMGFLRWRENASSDRDRFAPLILLPVELDRHSVTSQFRLNASGEELSTNLSLQSKLRTDFDITLPDLPAEEDLDIDAYFNEVAEAIRNKPEWKVERNDVQLNFFQFAKFLMYRDLDAEKWPDQSAFEENDLFQGLLGPGFEQSEPAMGPNERIDDRLSATNMVHVVDADSSQMAAIEEVRCGRNLVIQGPPGTGKSQTITNLVATAIREGKRVLFLAEKLAALEVVKQRLESIGLGDICLELHSNKSRKKEVLMELDRTLSLRVAEARFDTKASKNLDQLKAALNRTVDALHDPGFASGLTPFDIIGTLTRLHREFQCEPEIRDAVRMTDAPNWTADQYQEYREKLSDLKDLAEVVGPPNRHPFRGARCDPLLRSDIESLQTDLRQCRDAVKSVWKIAAGLAKSISVAAPPEKYRLSDIKRLCEMAEAVTSRPDVDPVAIQDDVWNDRIDDLAEVVEAGRRYRKAWAELDGSLNDGALEVSVEEARRHLNAYGRQFFLLRLFNGKYRAAINTLRELLRDELPKQHSARLQVLDSVIDCQKMNRLLSTDKSVEKKSRAAFGDAWNGVDSDWDALQATIAWVRNGVDQKLHSQFRKIAAKFEGDRSQLNERLQAVTRVVESLPALVTRIRDRLKLDDRHKFNLTEIENMPLPALIKWLDSTSEKLESLPDWVRYRIARDTLTETELKRLVRLVDLSKIGLQDVLPLYDQVYHDELLRALYSARPDLKSFSGTGHQVVRDRFREADHMMIESSRQEVSQLHRSRIPGGTLGGMRVLRHEIQKKGRHKSIRRLLKEAGPAVQDIKPVFMMSPLSVAQYLEPGAVEFDLLLIDEASQIEPVDALGAVARCRQVVVVGDQKQLPPTQFFSKSAEADENDDSDSARDLESILGLCVARGLPQKMLMWHYRSQHQSLIAVSNHEYYEDRLFVVPSPIRNDPAMGVKFIHVEDGVYERGGSTTNPREADVVAQHVIDHARQYPDLSLGVAAFSVRQRDAILDRVELLERQNPDVIPFFQKTGVDGFFVKNLETIQGDERDVIFISVGYGKDRDGRMTQNFGPLNRDGGERRLNVLISRAKQKCSVFSSIVADDIQIQGTTARGVVGLKRYLQFAETGVMDMAEATGRGFDSDFEREVARAVAGYGHALETQVGVAGFFIDLAVVDPERPGRYLLGIECDGASYHSSRSARDRDRLREEVLRGRGWEIHRIWSTDWYQQPETELKKVLAAIDAATKRDPAAKLEPVRPQTRADLHNETSSTEPPAPQRQRIGSLPAEEEKQTQTNEYGIEVSSYEVANCRLSGNTAIPDMSPADLDAAIEFVVSVEGPIHQDEIGRRLAAATGSRASKGVTQAVQGGVMRLASTDQVQVANNFVTSAAAGECIVRDRSDVTVNSLKNAENIPPEEIAVAATSLIKVNSSAETDELVRAVAAVMGFSRAGVKVKQRTQEVIEGLVAAGELIEREGVLMLGTRVESAVTTSHS